MTIDETNKAALVHHQAGRLVEAEALYRQALAQNPNQAECQSNLGTLLAATGRLDEAVGCFRRAIQLRPQLAQTHFQLGVALRTQQKMEDAIVAFRQAASLQPTEGNAQAYLADTLLAAGHLDEAVTAWRVVIAQRPNQPEAHMMIGVALHRQASFDAALTAFGRAIALNPKLAAAYNNLSQSLLQLTRFDEAADAARRAIALEPNLRQAHMNLGLALTEKDLDGAIAAHRRALALDPNYVSAHRALALDLLLKGEFAEGWVEHEWRLRDGDMRIAPDRAFSQPRWDGQPLGGRRIFVHVEQGFGDMINFARYVPLVAAMGGRVILECQPQLHRLMESLAGVEQLVDLGQPLPDFDVQCPALSLPLAMGTTADNIPADVPYLFADPQRAATWKARLAELPAAADARIRAGLVWSGSPKFEGNTRRSMALRVLAPLGQVPGVWFCSLQKGHPAAQAKDPPPGLALTDWYDQLDDFAETAALLANLDVLITVDTSVAHLAGAMGKRVWLMLGSMADWRWLLNRTDSPWYPTMRLFRQKSAGDWQPVIAEIANALADLGRG